MITRQMSWWDSAIDHLTRMRGQMKYSISSRRSLTISGPCSHGGLQLARGLLEIQHRREKSSRRFLQCVEENFLTQLAMKATRGYGTCPSGLAVCEHRRTGRWCSGWTLSWAKTSWNDWIFSSWRSKKRYQQNCRLQWILRKISSPQGFSSTGTDCSKDHP